MRTKIILLFVQAILMMPFTFIQSANSEPFPLDTIFPLVNEYSYKRCPSIASIDSNYFVVWEKCLPSGYKDIRGTRVFSNGDVEYKDGIIIADSSDSPVISSFGDKFMIFYRKNGNLHCRSLLIDNNTYDLSGEFITDVDFSVINEYKAYSNSGYFGIFYTINPSIFERIGYFTIIDSLGNIIAPPETIFVDNLYYEWHYKDFDLSNDSNNYLLVYIYVGTLYGIRISNSGNILDTLPIKISDDTIVHIDNISVHYNGYNYMVVWRDTSNNIYGNRVSPEGVVLDSFGFPIAQYPGKKEYPLLSYNGVNYLITYNVDDFYSACRGTRFTPDCIVIDTPGFHITRYLNDDMIIGFNENGSFLCWSNNDSGLNEIHGLRLSSEGILIDTSDIIITDVDSICNTAFNQNKSSSAYSHNSGKYLVVWEDDRNYPGSRIDIYGIFIDTLGNRSAAFPISSREFWEHNPEVTYGNGRWFLTWEYGDQIHGTTIMEDETISIPNGKIFKSHDHIQYYNPIVSSIGNRFILVYLHSEYPLDYFGIAYTLVDSLNNIISNGGLEFGSCYPEFTGLDVSSKDSIFFITYGAYYSDALSSRDGIYLNRRHYDGTAADTGAIELKQPYKSGAKSEYINNRLMLVWTDGQAGYKNLYGAIYDSLGSVLVDSIIISDANGDQKNVALEYNDQNFIAMWEDYRNNSKGDIYGATIGIDGVILDSGAIITGDSAHISPNLEKGPENQMFLTYSGWTDSINGSVVNKMRIWGVLDSFLNGIDTLVNDTTITDTTVIDTIKTINLMSRPFPDYIFANCNNSIIFKYYLSSKINVHLSVFNIVGIQIFGYDNYSDQNIGINQISVNSSKLPNGIYFYKFKAGKTSKSGKIIILH
jgi:hypothetical protein